MATITMPDGTSVRYGYDPQPSQTAPSTSQIQRLTGVERLDSLGVVVDSTTYHYEDARFGWHVTGITDHRGVRVATYAYDARGRAISTSGANGAGLHTIEYGTSPTGLTRRVTNPLGRASVYRFDQFGSSSAPDLRLVGVDGEASPNCPASAASYGYNAAGHVDTMTDEELRTTRITRDALGRATRVVEADGTPESRTTDFTWRGQSGRLARVERATRTVDYTYDASDRLSDLTVTDETTHTVPYATNGRTRSWGFSYTPEGLLSTVDGPLPGPADTVSYTYDANGYLSRVENEVGHVTVIFDVDARGAPLEVRDPNGVATVFEYDALGRVEDIVVAWGVDSSRYQLRYTPAGDVERLDLPGGAFITYAYDARRRMISATNDRGEVTRYAYDAMDAVTSVTVESSSAAIVYQASYAYDELGRAIRAIGANLETTSFAYDRVGNPTSVTDPRNEVFSHAFDGLNRLVSETDPGAHTIGYGFDDQDRLTRLTDARALVTTRLVDGFGQTIQEDNPDAGVRQYWYDEAGRLVRVRDAGGDDREFSYDALGRVLTAGFPLAPQEDVTFTYDGFGPPYGYGMGRLTRVDDESGATEFAYDRQGRLTSRTKTMWANTYATGYAYDANGAVTRMTLPSGREVHYDRASDGRVTAVRTRDGSSGPLDDVATNVAYQGGLGLTGLQYGNGLGLEHRYDQNAWLTDIIVGPAGGAALLDLEFFRDDRGGLTGQFDHTPSRDREAYFGYTPEGRLEWANGPWGERGYVYDGAGNRTETRVVIGGGPAEFVFEVIEPDSNRVAEVRGSGWTLLRSFDYGAQGELVREVRGADTYEYFYNWTGRLVGVSRNGVTVGAYGYDAFGHRVWRDVDGGATASLDYVFDDAGRLLAIHDVAGGTVLREYIWLDDRLIAIVDASGPSPALYFVHTGQRREPLAVTDASGVVVLAQYLEPYGIDGLISGAATLDLRMPGQWMQDETGGLAQNWFRDYDPTLARYVQPDPLGLAAGANLYAYVDGDPLNAVDPTGLCYGCYAVPITANLVRQAANAWSESNRRHHQRLVQRYGGPPPGDAALRAMGRDVPDRGNPMIPADDLGDYLDWFYAGVGAGAICRPAPLAGATPRAARAGPDLAGLFAGGRIPTATELAEYGARQGWRAQQAPNGPLKFFDQQGFERMVIKQGSLRTPGSGYPHVSFRPRGGGYFIDPVTGGPVTRNSPGNHRPIRYDLP